jgi:hypothetical protein
VDSGHALGSRGQWLTTAPFTPYSGYSETPMTAQQGGEMTVIRQRVLVVVVLVCLTMLLGGLQAVLDATCCQNIPRGECEAESTCWPDGTCPDSLNMCYVNGGSCRWIGCHPAG